MGKYVLRVYHEGNPLYVSTNLPILNVTHLTISINNAHVFTSLTEAANVVEDLYNAYNIEAYIQWLHD